MPYIGKGANGFGIRERYRYSASSSQTAFTGSDLDSKTLQFDSGSLLDVYLNGVLLDTADYNTSTANTVTLTSGATASDEVMIVVYDVFSLSDAMPKTGGTFTGGVTGTTATFSGDLTVDTNTLKVDSSNNRVGIGEASPSAPLHMDTGATTDIMRFGSGGRWGFQIQNSDPRYVAISRAMNSSSSPVLSIDGDTGHVGINTSTPDASYQFCIKENGAGVGIKLEPTGTSCESYIQLKFQNTSNTTRSGMIKGDNGDTLRIASADAIGIGFETSDSQALHISSDGSLRLQHVYDDTTGNSANMYIHSDGTHQVMRSTSSERYKKNVETLEDKYADAILGLRPVWYKSKCEADNPDYSYWGLIAEEVAKVDPRLVTFRNEYTEDIGDGKWKVVKLDAPQAESVQYDRLVPHLINICKRQEDKITALEARIKALESK